MHRQQSYGTFSMTLKYRGSSEKASLTIIDNEIHDINTHKCDFVTNTEIVPLTLSNFQDENSKNYCILTSLTLDSIV